MKFKRITDEVRHHYRREGATEVLTRAIHRLYESVGPHRTRAVFRTRINRLRGYDVPLDPMATVYVDPNSIEYSTNTRFRPVLRHIGRDEGGDWDLDPVPLDSEATARGLRQRFEDGLDWEKTDYFAMLIESNESELGCSSIKDAHRRCAYLDQLYDRMKTEGYQVHRKVRPPEEIQRSHHQTTPLEITVHVNRNETYLLQDGNHRLSMAQLIGFDEIPAIVCVRHKQAVS